MYLYTVKTSDGNIFTFNTFYDTLVMLRRAILEFCEKRICCAGCPFDEVPISKHKLNKRYYSIDRLCHIQFTNWFNHREEVKILQKICNILDFELKISKEVK